MDPGAAACAFDVSVRQGERSVRLTSLRTTASRCSSHGRAAETRAAPLPDPLCYAARSHVTLPLHLYNTHLHVIYSRPSFSAQLKPTVVMRAETRSTRGATGSVRAPAPHTHEAE